MIKSGSVSLQASASTQSVSPLPSSIRLKRHPRRKRLAFQVTADGCLQVFAPIAWSLKRIKDVLRENEARILKAMAEASTALDLKAKREWLWFLGEPYKILSSSASELVLDLKNQTISVPVLWDIHDEQEAYKWLLKRRARPLLQERLQYCAATFDDLPDFRLGRIGTPTSRWGSCSRSGNINLSALLLQYPLSCIDYVITHELCHLYEFNHSQAFYERLTAAMPDWNDRELWFKWPLPTTWESLCQDKRSELLLRLERLQAKPV